MPEDVDRHDSTHPPASLAVPETLLVPLAVLPKEPSKTLWIDLEIVVLAVHEDGPGAAIPYCVGRSDECERRHDDLVVGFDTRNKQRQMEGGGTTRRRDPFRHPTTLCDHLFELRNV